MVRSTCKHADLVMERAERVHDEVAQIYEASGGLPLEDCLSCAEACELHARFEAALRELESVDIEDALPPAVGFAEPSILVELSATRESLQVAILQTRPPWSRCRRSLRAVPTRTTRSAARMQSTVVGAALSR